MRPSFEELLHDKITHAVFEERKAAARAKATAEHAPLNQLDGVYKALTVYKEAQAKAKEARAKAEEAAAQAKEAEVKAEEAVAQGLKDMEAVLRAIEAAPHGGQEPAGGSSSDAA